ncbi:hypothetical protein QNI16_12435 [Cytophagaceae bacterium YF14B1]|uniref:Uncharacterized protein n=1 Tax=Xanthocytophaga flava TaxID=3048013 RepID=A0AAE3QMB0_9BACT|nr:hypothetical protein [Xanthocytophaga flavus]MDJ1481296.1 hypothetical protein [Xanthocytophaga flavus]
MNKYLLLFLLLSCSSPKVEKVTVSLVTMPPPPYPEYPIEVKSDGTVEPVRLYLKENLKNWDSYKPLTWKMDTVDNKEIPKVKYIVKHSYSTKNHKGKRVKVVAEFFLDEYGQVIKMFPVEK